MKIIDGKALLLKLRSPKQVTAVIPKSRAVSPNEVLVKWGVDEVFALRNMNIKVPSPIEGRYAWPGQYKPMGHQRTTASFLTLNKRAFCFNEQGCVDSETEYLSPTGWIKISEYAGGKVAQYDPHSKEIEFVDPEEYVKLPCADMLRIKTKYGIDQLLSPEHRVLLEDGKAKHGKVETISAEVLAARHHMYHVGERTNVGGTKAGTDTIAFSAATIPTTFLHIPTTAMPYTEAQLRVLTAVIADGYFGSNTNHCVIRLKKVRKQERLHKLLQGAGIEYTAKPCKPEGFLRFAFTSPERWKEFGKEFWAASASQMQVIADEVLHWDGSVTRGERFSTTSKASADFVQYVFAARRHVGGGTARITQRKREGKLEYTVQVRQGTNRLYLRGTDETISVEPSTDGFKYCFRVPSTYLVFRRNGCIFASGNTGKTASAIWAADFLMTQGKVHRVLIICPLSIMDSAWRADLFSVAMHRSIAVAHGDAKKRRAILAQNTEFVVINYDGVEVVAEDIAKGGFDLIIVDEATHYKNAQSKRWKVLNKLVTPDTWLWLMTGTPAAQSPVDSYGLAKLIDSTSVPRNFNVFKDTVMQRVSQYRWEPKETATDTVYRILQPAIRFLKSQCLDLPDLSYIKRTVELTAQQKKYYTMLKKHLALDLTATRVTAVNAAIAMSKLLQISAGAVYDEDGDSVHFDISNRYNVLKEVIDETRNKVLVFVPFKHAIELITDKLRKDGYDTEVIQGDVTASKRTDIINRFQTTKSPRVLVIQPQAAAHGVTLTAADTIIWWGPTSSLETYAQANARIHRSGQVNKCTIVQLVGSPVEARVYQLLDQKIDVHSKLIDLYDDLID